MRSVFLCSLLLLIVFTTGCTNAPEEPMAEWIQLSDFPGEPRASGAAFVLNDKAYLCCGRTGTENVVVNEVWSYDAGADRWTQLDTFPGKPRVKPVGVVINGKSYVGMGGGGAPYEETYYDFYEFDPLTGKWTEKAPYPGYASNDLAYAVVNGCLYTTMGITGTLLGLETYRYDPENNTWTRLQDCPYSYSAPAFFSIGSDFYVAGGFRGRNIRTVFRFDTEKNEWSYTASMPEGRILPAGLEVAGKGYVLLGRFWAGAENGGRLLSDIIAYNPADNTWTKKGDFPGGGRQNAFVFAMGGRGYVVMGEDDDQPLNDVWSFKP